MVMYRVKTDRVWDESGTAVAVYGVAAYTAAGRLLCAVPDLFFDREKAAAFVRLCRVEQPQPALFWSLRRTHWQNSTAGEGRTKKNPCTALPCRDKFLNGFFA